MPWKSAFMSLALKKKEEAISSMKWASVFFSVLLLFSLNISKYESPFTGSLQLLIKKVKIHKNLPHIMKWPSHLSDIKLSFGLITVFPDSGKTD